MPPADELRPAQLPKRNAWEIQRAVLFALVLREMKSRVGGQWVGAIWTLFEPLTHVLILLTLYHFIRSAGPADIPIPVFLVTGLVPYFLFQHLALRLMDGIDANRGLFSYRQVKPLDTLMSRACVETLMNLFVYVFSLGILGWLGYPVLPADPLQVVETHMVILLLGAGCGVLLAVVTHERPRIRSLVRMTMMPLYITSGVIFPIDILPPEALDVLLYNPVLHLVELSRHGFLPAYEPAYGVNMMYPFMFMLSVWALALLTYRADRLRLVTTT